jgi:hypothetical protein
MFWFTGFLQEFSDPLDADDARCDLDGRKFDGSRIIVEFARGVNICCLQLFFTAFDVLLNPMQFRTVFFMLRYSFT